MCTANVSSDLYYCTQKTVSMSKVYFISGIDTNIGKSVATGWIARGLINKGKKVITQKLIQTGNRKFSEDIELHRKIMGIKFLDEDRHRLTAPVIYTYPASPHLAARLDKRELDMNVISKSTENLTKKYDIVLLEGAGGLMVPLTENLLTIDYIAEKKYPVILVTSGRLGSINHTLLSLEALKRRNIELRYIVYNLFPVTDSIIAEDTMSYIKRYAQNIYPQSGFITIPEIEF